MKTIIVGAVLYDPKVSVIWDIIGEFLEAHGCPIDLVFFRNYDLQVTSLLERHIDVAWNSPLAWLDAQRRSSGTCRAIAMRDTDRDRVSQIVVPASGPVKSPGDLQGKTIACGAWDSPQATLIPLGHLARLGLEPGRDVKVRRFDILVGQHGDHVGGEREAFDCMARGEADASALLDLNWDAWRADGTISKDGFRVLATTQRFDHCVFTVREDFPRKAEEAWSKALFSMRYDDPGHRRMMDLEGLKAWLPGRTSGFGPLGDAAARLGFWEGRGR